MRNAHIIYRDPSGTLEPDARPCRRAWCVVPQPHYSTPNTCCYCAGERPRHSAACVHNRNPLGEASGGKIGDLHMNSHIYDADFKFQDPTSHITYGAGGSPTNVEGIDAYAFHYEQAGKAETYEQSIVHAQLATAAAVMANTKALSDLYAIIDEFNRR